MESQKIVIATRKSPLALTQANLTVDHYTKALAGCECELLKLVSTGDKQQSWSLQEKGGKGLFTKELEDALLANEADIAVHSSKDLPSDFPEGLSIAGFLPREDARDVLVLRAGVSTPKTIATGSPRRQAQLKLMYPDAEFCEIRGNVDTRLNKIARGDADASVLARAGLNRLGICEWEGIEFRNLSLDESVPAVGQAAVGIECRDADVELYGASLDEAAKVAVTLERAFLETLGGGCQVAFAIHYDGAVLRIFHDICGMVKEDLSPERAKAEPHEVAREYIERFQLS